MEFSEPVGSEDPYAQRLKRQITEIILWADGQHERKSQVRIGPSELSSECDRQIGYRLAGIPATNASADPWAAIVGTAIHSWMDKAVSAWLAHTGTPNWVVESVLYMDDYVQGRCDLYADGTVVDYKTGGTDRMKQVRKDGFPQNYRNQVHIYGYGFAKKGFPVSRVALVLLPRSGMLRDMYVWTEPYSHFLAVKQLGKVERIGLDLLRRDVLSHPERWNDVPATPSHDCGYCSHYAFQRTEQGTATDQGCPGK